MIGVGIRESQPEPSSVEALKLLPCPFCGGSSLKARTDDIDGFIAHIECTDCDDMVGPMSQFKYEAEDDAVKCAAEVWNRRAPISSGPTWDTNHEGYRAIFNAALAGICANPNFFSSLFQQSPESAVEFANQCVLAAIRSNGGRA